MNRTAPILDRETSLAYQPALDGVRAVAVTLVLLFHAGFGWMRAGYLGVSVFFTLSGFLITGLLLREFDAHGAVSLRRFYSRRARRLLPASLLCMVGIVVARWLGEFRHVGGLRNDLLAAIAQVFNWTELAGSSSYGALFDGAPAFASPVEHYWSLAIEEQFYLVWPLILVGLARWARRRRVSTLGPLLVVTTAFALAAPFIAALWGVDAAYWATPARFAELLVGGCAAAWLRSGLVVHRRAGVVLAPACLTAILALSVLLPSGDGPAYRGGLAPFALLSAGLVLGLQTPGALRRAMSTRPVVWLGRISYGVYLFHWPVFVLLRQHGWVLTQGIGFVLAIAITLGVSAASYHLLERPVRTASWGPLGTYSGLAIASLAGAVAIVVMPPTRGFLQADSAVLEAAAIVPSASVEALRTSSDGTIAAPSTGAQTTAPGGPARRDVAIEPTTTVASTTTAPSFGTEVALPVAPNRPVRILVLGDSTAFYVGQGIAAWAVQHPQHAQVELLWTQGFGFITSGTITSWEASAYVERSAEILADDLPATVARLQPDVVLLMTTVDDVANRRWDDAEGVLGPTDEPFRQRMSTEYRAATELLTGLGVDAVVWVVPPVPHALWEAPEMLEPARYRVQHEVIREVAAAAGPTVTVVELDRWLTATGHHRDTGWRPDGTHLTEESATRVADRYLGPTLLRVALGLSIDG